MRRLLGRLDRRSLRSDSIFAVCLLVGGASLRRLECSGGEGQVDVAERKMAKALAGALAASPGIHCQLAANKTGIFGVFWGRMRENEKSSDL